MKKNLSVLRICTDENLVDQVHDLYSKQYKTIEEVAAIIGCSVNTMQTALGVLNYPHAKGQWLVDRVAKQKAKIKKYKELRKVKA